MLETILAQKDKYISRPMMYSASLVGKVPVTAFRPYDSSSAKKLALSPIEDYASNVGYSFITVWGELSSDGLTFVVKALWINPVSYATEEVVVGTYTRTYNYVNNPPKLIVETIGNTKGIIIQVLCKDIGKSSWIHGNTPVHNASYMKGISGLEVLFLYNKQKGFIKASSGLLEKMTRVGRDIHPLSGGTGELNPNNQGGVSGAPFIDPEIMFCILEGNTVFLAVAQPPAAMNVIPEEHPITLMTPEELASFSFSPWDSGCIFYRLTKHGTYISEYKSAANQVLLGFEPERRTSFDVFKKGNNITIRRYKAWSSRYGGYIESLTFDYTNFRAVSLISSSVDYHIQWSYIPLGQPNRDAVDFIRNNEFTTLNFNSKNFENSRTLAKGESRFTNPQQSSDFLPVNIYGLNTYNNGYSLINESRLYVIDPQTKQDVLLNYCIGDSNENIRHNLIPYYSGIFSKYKDNKISNLILRLEEENGKEFFNLYKVERTVGLEFGIPRTGHEYNYSINYEY